MNYRQQYAYFVSLLFVVIIKILRNQTHQQAYIKGPIVNKIMEEERQKSLSKVNVSKLLTTKLQDIVPSTLYPVAKRRDIDPQIRRVEESFRKINKQQNDNENVDGKNQIGHKTKGKDSSDHKYFSFSLAGFDNSKKKKLLDIIDILQYLYSEFESSKGAEFTENEVYEPWEKEQILRNNKGASVGDFIVKLPNPDNMPEQQDKQKKEKSDQTTTKMKNAMTLYDTTFDTEQYSQKNSQAKEKKAFFIAYYFLDIMSETKIIYVQRKYDKVQQFLKQFNYFKKICDIELNAYIQMSRDEKFQEIQKDLDKKFYAKRIQKFHPEKMPNSIGQIKESFKAFKKDIYQRLADQFTRKKQNDQKQYQSLFQNPFIVGVLQEIPSYTSLFRYLPAILNDVSHEIAQKFNNNKEIVRKLYNGEGLKKVSTKGELRWVLQDKRPKDLLTLIRRMLMYKFTRRGGLFARSFLSENEQQIFLVVKASQQHLQKMAQSQNFNMELEYGSIDLFAFEPVDPYLRPLRTNQYIRDLSFVRKYNLQENKEDKDDPMNEKSVESESVSMYKKAQDMNKEQLRAKIILDQQQCDQKYRWVSKTLNLSFIKGEQILVNQYNTKDVDKDVWPIYYIYNKLIIEGIEGLKKMYETKNQNTVLSDGLKKNIGLMLRLLFLKSLNTCNNLYLKHRKVFARSIRNIGKRRALQNIWNHLGQDSPRGYWPYFYSEKMDRMWRKYEINQQKDRSKFSPDDRTIITNQIILQLVNISKAKLQGIIIDYFPVHDPYILKNIKTQPYMNVVQNMVAQQKILVRQMQESGNQMRNMFIQYECEYTKEDFTKESVFDKLAFSFRKLTQFPVNTVAFYCGEKLALFFELRRFYLAKSLPFILPAIIFQIVFWVEQNQIFNTGTSVLTEAVDIMMTILVFFNILWIDYMIRGWQAREKSLARAFGTQNLSKKTTVRVLFEGQHYRNLATDQINYENVTSIQRVCKQGITLFFNIGYILMICAILLIIIVLKSQLFQQGYAQTVVTTVPSVLIAVSTKFFNFVYNKIVNIVIDFENKRTVDEYQSSLSTKSYVITFIITYFVIFTYGFFSNYFEGSSLCLIKTAGGHQIQNCYFYISNQLLTSALTDFAFTAIAALIPYAKFRYQSYQNEKKKNTGVTFNVNYFQSFDKFYQEQDRMSSFMYTNNEIDNTWAEYSKVILAFTTLALFGPVLPLLYIMVFLTGQVSLHSKKYEIIYFSKRSIPRKAKSIGENWILITKISAIIGVFVNLALVTYVRETFKTNKSVVFFAIAFTILILKYLISLIGEKPDVIGQRTKVKARDFVSERGLLRFNTNKQIINTDIENLYYDEKRLERKFPKLHKANIKSKK